MNNKNIIIAGVIAVGLYLFSQTKTTAQKVAQRIRPAATPTIRKRTAQKIAQKVARKVAQKVVKEKDEYVRERTPPTLAATIKKRTGVLMSEARRIAQKIAYERARKQRERIAAAHRAMLERAYRKRIQIAAENRKAAAQKIAQKVAQRTRSTAKPTIRKRTAQKVAQKIAQKVAQKVVPVMKHKTTHSSWTPTAWPVHTVHKKSTLFNYFKPQKKKDLSVLHTAIKWRRALTPPRPKSSIRKAVAIKKQRALMGALYAKAAAVHKLRLLSGRPIQHWTKPRARKIVQKSTQNKSPTDKRKKIHKILSHRKYPLYWQRRRPHVAMRRR